MKKAVRAVVAALLVLLVVCVGLVSVSLGRIIKAAVETAGPRVLGASVTLDSVTLAPWSGRGTLHGLLLGNPEGFKGAHAVKIGEVSVTVRLSSLMTDMIVVDRIVVRAPEISYEMSAGGSNLARLQKNAEGSSSSLGAGGAKPPADGKGGKSIFIKDLLVTGGRVGLSAPGLGGKDLVVAMPDVHLTELGGKGRSSSEVAAQVLRELTGAAGKAVSGAGSKSLEAAAGAAAKALGSLGGLFKGGK